MSLIKDIEMGMSVNTAGFAAAMRNADKNLAAFDRSAKRLGKVLESLTISFDAVSVATKAFDAVKSAVGRATDLEKSITGLAKATDLEGAGLASLKDELYALSTEMKGVRLDDILSIATSGAKMGVATDELIDYTKGVAMLSTAADDIPADTLAEQVGTLNAVFKLGNKGALQMGSALDKIADSGISSNAGILDVTARIAGTANAMKLGAGESMAMAAALLDTGTQSEQAASSLNNLLMNMVAVGNHAEFAKTAGINVKEFGDLVAGQPMKAIQAFLGGLSKLDAAAQLEALDAAGIKAQERQSSLQKMAQQTEKLSQYTAIAANEFKTLNQITASYNATAKETDAYWKQFDNRVSVISDTLGSTFLPAINSVLGTVGEKLDQANVAAKKLIDTLSSFTPGFLKGLSVDVSGALGEGMAASLMGPLGPLLSDSLSVFGKKQPKPAAKVANEAAAAKQALVAQQVRNTALEDVGPIETKASKKAADKAAKAAESAQKKAAAKTAREAAAAQKRLTSQAQDVIEATRAPMEQYKTKVAELNTLLGAKAIDATTFKRAESQARKDIFGTSDTSFAGAALKGSQEAYSAQLRFAAMGQDRDEPLKEVAKEAPKQTELLRQVVTGLTKIADRAGAGAVEFFTGL